MPTIHFENLLSKKIAEASPLGVATNDLDDTIYIILAPEIEFLERPIEEIILSTGPDKTIIYILIILSEPINPSFRDIMCEAYGGDPAVMVAAENLPQESTSELIEEDGFKATLSSTTRLLKKGTMNDADINNISWKKDSFELLLCYNYRKNREEVHFKVI